MSLVGEKVYVFWEDEKSFFPGKVVEVTGNMCDVLYDELVNGKPCVEKNIPPWRYFQTGNKAICNFSYTISNIIKLKDEGKAEDSDFLDENTLDALFEVLLVVSPENLLKVPEDLFPMIASACIQKLLGLAETSGSILMFERIQGIAKDPSVDISMDENFIQSKSLMQCCYILLYMLTFNLVPLSHVSHEVLEGIVGVIKQCVDLFVEFDNSKDSSARRSLPFNIFGPILLSIMEVLLQYLSTHIQYKNERFIICCYENAIYMLSSVCEFDDTVSAIEHVPVSPLTPSKASVSDELEEDRPLVPERLRDIKGMTLMVKLHVLSSKIVCIIYSLYQSLRSAVVVEMLPCLLQLGKHNARYVSVLESQVFITGSSLKSGASWTVLSTVFVAFMSILQSSIFVPVPMDKSVEVRVTCAQTHSSMISSVDRFIGEVLKRCMHKDTCLAYRKAFQTFVSEIFSVIFSPNFPIAMIVLERISLIVNAQLRKPASTLKAEKENYGDAGNSYQLYLLDLSGLIGVSIQDLLLKEVNSRDSNLDSSNNILDDDEFCINQSNLSAMNEPESGFTLSSLPSKLQKQIDGVIREKIKVLEAKLNDIVESQTAKLNEILKKEKEAQKIKDKAIAKQQKTASNSDNGKRTRKGKAETEPEPPKKKSKSKDVPSQKSKDVEEPLQIAKKVVVDPAVCYDLMDYHFILQILLDIINFIVDVIYEYGDSLGKSISRDGSVTVSDIMDYLSRHHPDIIRFKRDLMIKDIIMALVLQYYQSLFSICNDDRTVHSNMLLAMSMWFAGFNNGSAGIEANGSIDSDEDREKRTLQASIDDMFVLYQQYSHGKLLADKGVILPKLLQLITPKKTDTWRPCFFFSWAVDCFKEFFTSSATGSLQDGTKRIGQLQGLFEGILRSCAMIIPQSTSISLRSKVIKLYSSFIEVNELLMEHSVVQSCVEDLLYDSGISVREEIVKLLGVYLNKSAKDIPQKFLDLLILKLHDSGVSVRKAVVGVLKEFLTRNPNASLYAPICLMLLEQASLPKEEDTVKDLIFEMFQRLWFRQNEDIEAAKPTLKRSISTSSVSSVSSQKSRRSVSGDSAFVRQISESKNCVSPVPLSPVKKGKTPVGTVGTGTTWIRSIALKIVEVVAAAGIVESSLGWILGLLRELLYVSNEAGDTKSITKNKRNNYLSRCEEIVSSLFELLLLCEEEDKEIKKSLKLGYKQQIVAIISTIHLFCEAYPAFIIKYLDSLVPYLKYSNGGDSSDFTADEVSLLCVKVAEILSFLCIIPQAGNAISVRSKEINHDLTLMALKMNNAGIEKSVKGLVDITCRVTNDPFPILELAQRCFDSIMAILIPFDAHKSTGIVMNPAMTARIERCLIILGYLCENCYLLGPLWDNIPKKSHFSTTFLDKCTDSVVADMNLFNIGKIISGPRLGGICYCISAYILTLNGDMYTTLHSRAVQALCNVFVGNPSLLILCSERGLLEQLLSPDIYSENVHEKLLVSLKRVLDCEENRLTANANESYVLERSGSDGDIRKPRKDEITASKKGLSEIGLKVLGPQESEDDHSCSGFVLQQHLHTIIQYLFYSQYVKLRLAALNLIGVLLRQGLICPLDVLGPLIAVLGDALPEIRTLSMTMLQSQDEKHNRFLENRLIEGIDLCHKYQCAIHQPVIRDVDEVLSSFSVGDEDSSYIVQKPRYISIFSTLFSTCIFSTYSGNTNTLVARKSRHDIENSLLKYTYSLIQQLRTTNSPSSSLNGGYVPLSRAIELSESAFFFMTTLAHLPYEYYDDPLNIIHLINRSLPYYIGLLANGSKARLNMFGAVERVEGKMQPPMLGAVKSEMVSKQSSVSTNGCLVFDEVLFVKYIMSLLEEEESKSSSTFLSLDTSKSCFNAMVFLVGFAIECRCLEGLLRLKLFLKSYYKLSDDKCQSFNPMEKNSSGSGEKFKDDGDDTRSARFLSQRKGAVPFSALTLSGFSEELCGVSNNGSSGPLEAAALLEIARVCVGDYNRLISSFESDSIGDFNLVAYTEKKEKEKRKKLKVSVSAVAEYDRSARNTKDDDEDYQEVDDDDWSPQVSKRKKRKSSN